MLNIRKILVPTDFSPAAAQALQWAAELAQQFQSSLLLLHVVPPSAYPLHNAGRLRGFPDLREEILKRCREEMQGVVEQAAKCRVETSVLEGVPHTEIVDAAAREHADLIVMGTHGHTGLEHVLLGSVAERVVRTAHVPVLTVRESAPA